MPFLFLWFLALRGRVLKYLFFGLVAENRELAEGAVRRRIGVSVADDGAKGLRWIGVEVACWVRARASSKGLEAQTTNELASNRNKTHYI